MKVTTLASGSISQFTNWTQLAMLNWYFSSLPETGTNIRPINWFMGLSTTVPTSSGGSITEPVGAGYSRQAINFLAATGNPGQVTNQLPLNFTANGGDWGTIVYGLVYDGLTLGHCLVVGPLENPRTIHDGDTLQFQTGSLAVGLI